MLDCHSLENRITSHAYTHGELFQSGLHFCESNIQHTPNVRTFTTLILMGDRSRLSFWGSSCKQVSLERERERESQKDKQREWVWEEEKGRRGLRAGWETERQENEKGKENNLSPFTHDGLTWTSVLFEAPLVMSLFSKNSARAWRR